MYVGVMSETGEDMQHLFAAELIVNRLHLALPDARIQLPMQDQHRTGDVPGIIDGVVVEGVETVLEAAPEDERFGKRESKTAHRPEASANGRQHAVEGALDDKGVGLDAELANGARTAAAPIDCPNSTTGRPGQCWRTWETAAATSSAS